MKASLSLFFIFVTGLILSNSACRPDYPKCKNDQHCREKEFCVNGQCQKCRDDKDCDKGQACNNGRCEAIPGYCEQDSACPEGQVCKNNRCAACQSDGDCGSGGRCRQGKCLKANQCKTDEDCPENWECQNGICVAPPETDSTAACTPSPIYFEFDEFVLSEAARTQLQAALACIKSVANRTVRVEGHCDSRGTDEYNLALGDRRAQAVVTYLKRLGVADARVRPVAKGEIEATGTDEESWKQDRKVVFIWE